MQLVLTSTTSTTLGGRIVVPHLGIIIYVLLDPVEGRTVFYQRISETTPHVYRAPCDENYTLLAEPRCLGTVVRSIYTFDLAS